jgi:hypothetical protein
MLFLSPDTMENYLGYVCLLYQEIEISCECVFIVSGELSCVSVFIVSGDSTILNTHTHDISIS